MYIKLINLATHGQAAYSNSGSSAQALNYLKQEAGKDGQEAAFFNSEEDGLSAQDSMHDIDSNVKGLRADDAKFYSLVISPGEAKLAHIDNDEEKRKEYTRKVMEQYAQNFQLVVCQFNCACNLPRATPPPNPLSDGEGGLVCSSKNLETSRLETRTSAPSPPGRGLGGGVNGRIKSSIIKLSDH